MPLVELLDSPLEWVGAVFASSEDMVADEIGLTHPRWGGPRWAATGPRTPTARTAFGQADATRQAGDEAPAATER